MDSRFRGNDDSEIKTQYFKKRKNRGSPLKNPYREEYMLIY